MRSAARGAGEIYREAEGERVIWIAIAELIALVVVVGTILFVPLGEHQSDGLCEHGRERVWCPECNGFGEEN